MRMIFDIVLLLASGAASIYCFVLSRRLSGLDDTRNGIGASIASMSRALDQMQQALALAKDSGIESIRHLTELMEDAERIKPELSALIVDLSQLAELAVEDIEQARTNAISEIDRYFERARESAAAPPSPIEFADGRGSPQQAADLAA